LLVAIFFKSTIVVRNLLFRTTFVIRIVVMLMNLKSDLRLVYIPN